MKRICIGGDFSPTPIGRYPSDGESCGENFRKRFLVPALREAERVEVVIDDVEGYGSSFLEEAFGGLIRKEGFKISDLREKLKIVCHDEDFKIYEMLITKYISDASKNGDV
ncbi:STAS-like domain-containing protein [Luteolibacter marinus]|uniref:STAS-like domain-containing protein n=1 Tax=Luteolibacter marinus TaxID=2776705 RepID=UPI0018692A9F